jgi:amino acid adenylation domain-containing protein
MLLQDTVTTQAERRPEACALVSGRERVSYGQLEKQTNQVARLLAAAGCKAGDRVGILLPKSVPAIAGLLGALKAGCIYVPMDTHSPAARLARIVESCQPRCILANGESADVLERMAAGGALGGSVRIGWLDPAGSHEPAGVRSAFRWADLAAVPDSPTGIRVTPDDAAHILFTSGSTGVPKGVVILHRNVLAFLDWAIPYFGTNASDRISCHPPLHFDLSTFDMYGAFLAGAELHLVPTATSLLPQKLAEFIRGSRLTQWFSVPSVLKFMAQFDVVAHGGFPDLKRVLWCGEALPAPALIYWMKRLPKVHFTNLYGPTEATIASSYYTVPRCPESETEPIPIGVACAGEELAVLDERLKPLPAGQIGDLYIKGAGLSPGYWRDPEKTRAVFLEDGQGGRMYKTGDLARLGDDGLIYLLGRSDSQIKSRGYRIELGEIETALYTLPDIRECAVVAIPSDGFEGMAICCAYVLAPPSGSEPAELREKLGELVPSYMLPSRWLRFEELPLNANGKIDRPRLREHFLASAASV